MRRIVLAIGLLLLIAVAAPAASLIPIPWFAMSSAAVKSMSRARYPGVAALAMLEASIDNRCERSASAWP